MGAWDTYGTPLSRSPAFQKEWTYATSVQFSSNAVSNEGLFSAGSFGENGPSSVIVASPGPKYSFIIWGWQGVYIAVAGANKGHTVIKIANNSNSSYGLIHFSDDDNTVVNLSQPVRLQPGEDIIFKVMDSDMNATDSGIIELFYSVINGYEE